MAEINTSDPYDTTGFETRMEAMAQCFDRMAGIYRRAVSNWRAVFWTAALTLPIYLWLFMMAAMRGSWIALLQVVFASMFAMRAGQAYGEWHEARELMLEREANAARVRADIVAHQALAEKLQYHFALDTSATPH